MDLLDAIKNRRTVREYTGRKVSRETIEKVIEAGRWAPSAHNIQPWRFIVLDDYSKIEAVAYILEEKAAKVYSGFNIVMRDTAKNMRSATVLLAAYSNGAILKKFSKLGPPYDEIARIYEEQSVAAAIQNMLLYGGSLGLGMAWYGMALFCEKEINDLLGQKGGRLQTVLSLGYPLKEKHDATGRKELSEIAEFIG